MWNYLQLMLGNSAEIEPLIGTAGMTREQAHAKVQYIIDNMAGDSPAFFAAPAETWRRGAKDDTVYVQLPSGMVVWALYEYPDEQPPERAAMEWIEDFANIMRQGGLTNITVAKFPDQAEPAAPDEQASAAPDVEEDLTLAAARRIAGHVRELRRRYPNGLANLKNFATQRGQNGLPDWPEWCWLPMSAAQAIASNGNPFYDRADIGRVAAVGQWKLQNRAIVIPTEDVASESVPGPTPEPHEMDLLIPRERLLQELAGACYYLVMPHARPADHDGPWLYGTYIHLEWDQRDGGSTELRLLLDFGNDWQSLTPIYVFADLPTLAWSAREIEAGLPDSLPGFGGEVAGSIAATFQRLGAWWAWPLVGSLLDERALLIGPKTLDDPGLDAMVRGASAWELTYDRPRLTPLGS